MAVATFGTASAGQPERWYDTVVVGGGQAGLAVGHHLARRDVDFVIVDGGDRIGESWRSRWDSLRLFTPARYSGLPGMPFPDLPEHFPDKDQVADYLERYAERFDLTVLLGTRVTRLERARSGFALHAGDRLLRARNVVVATGPFQRPRVPEMATRLGSLIHQLHTAEYRSPFDLPDGPVLVVGAGNSGAQVALELSRFHHVTLAGRDLRRLPRAVFGVDVFRWLWPVFHRSTRGSWLGRAVRRRMDGTDPLIGITAGDFRSHGVKRVGRVDDVHDGLPHVGGAPVDVRTVVWATGYDRDFGWIDIPVFGPDGAPVHRRGETEVPGLYFVGLRFQYRPSSALLGGVGEDAEYVACRIARRA